MVHGKVESHSRDKSGFRIGQQWYNTNPGVPTPDRFDVVSFEPAQGTDGRWYLTAPATIIEKGQNPGFGGGGGKPGGGKGGGKGGYDNVGQQVGNAITNATALIAAGIVPVQEGKLVDTMTALAKQIMKAGDNVRAAPAAPNGPASQPQAAPQAQPQAAPQAQQPAPQPQPQAQPQQAPGGVPEVDDEIPLNEPGAS